MRSSPLFTLLALPLFVACPPAPDVGEADAIPDADVPPTRTFLLGVALETYDITSNPPWISSSEPLGVPPRAEAVVVPLHRIGIPWRAFDNPSNEAQNLPEAWVQAFDTMTAGADATGLPALLALSPISEHGDLLAPEASDIGGALSLDLQWKGYCYDPGADGDPTRWQRAYGGFVAWVSVHSAVTPTWIEVGSGMALVERACGKAVYDALKPWYGAADAAVKATGSTATTLVSVLAEQAYGFGVAGRDPTCATPFGVGTGCLEDRMTLLEGLGCDQLGVRANVGVMLAQTPDGGLPDDWLTRLADSADRPIGFLAVSAPSRYIPALDTTCSPLAESDDVVQRQVLRDALEVASEQAISLLVWDPIQDLLEGSVMGSCPCAGDSDVCSYLDLLGAKANDLRLSAASGLFEYDGTPKLGAALWTELME